MFTNDSVWVNPQGTFKGLEQIQKYAAWIYQGNKDFKIMENGNGIIAQGDNAFIEHEVSGTLNGNKWAVQAACAWQFKNGKVAKVTTFYDVLGQAQQATRGMSNWMVNMVANATKKGLQ